MSQYLRTLMDPENHQGRIPDPSTWASSTYQIVENVELTTASDGAVGFVMSPTPVTPSSTGWYHGIVSSNTEASGAQGVWLTGTAIAAVSSAAVITNFRNYRPVSGCICVEYIGDTNTDAGTICCLPLFRGEAAPISLSAAVSLPYNEQFPLRNGCRMLYKPLDNGDLEYWGGQDSASPSVGLAATGYGLWTGQTPPTAFPVNGSNAGERAPPAFCVMISGAKASTKVARVRAVFNYESIPFAASLGLFSSAKVASDPQGIASAMNVMSSVPWGEAWQGVAGTAGRIASELSQSVFSHATNMAGAALLDTVRRRGGWRTGESTRSLGWIPRDLELD